MAKYDALRDLLRESTSPVTMTFAELSRLVGGLPDSARTHRSWWDNTHAPTQVHAQGWVTAGWVVEHVDLNVGEVTFVRGVVRERTRASTWTTSTPRPPGTPGAPRRPTGPDGAAQLATVLRRAGYPTTLHPVAAHTTMLHPDVVAQTGGRPVFAAIRLDRRTGAQLGTVGEADGTPATLDDNRIPISSFLWAARYQQGIDMQLNHIWSRPRNRLCHAALWNLCLTPAFLAKTTDGSSHPEVRAALQRRAFELFGYLPNGDAEPVAPDGYADLEWAPHPLPVADLEAVYRREMASKPKHIAVLSARALGWLFSGWRPDSTL